MMILERELELGEVPRLAPSLDRIRAIVKAEGMNRGDGSCVEHLHGIHQQETVGVAQYLSARWCWMSPRVQSLELQKEEEEKE